MFSTDPEAVRLTGRVVRPGDDAYPAASAAWNRRCDAAPAVIVFAQQPQDVVHAVRWARERGVELRVRSGRHSLVPGWSNVDDGLVIDVSELKGATIDAEAGTATVGAGLSQLEAVTALGRAGLATATGTEGSVGLVGATLGGGFGLLTRLFGMASDNLLAAEIVVPTDDGGAELIRVDADRHPDLLWALRGAGNGSFGVVTSLTYRVHPLDGAVYVTVHWPGLQALVPVFDLWQRSAPYADRRFTSQLEITRDGIVLIAVLAGGTADEARALLAPLLALGEPLVSVKTGAWADIYTGFQIPLAQEPANWAFRSHFAAEPFPPTAIELIGSFLATAPTAACNYFTNAFGGAVAGSAPVGGSAFAHRDAMFYAEPGAGWGARNGDTPAESDPLTRVCMDWVDEFARALRPFVHGAYVNVPNPGEADPADAYWGANAQRLRTVKARYDPQNLFLCAEGIDTRSPSHDDVPGDHR